MSRSSSKKTYHVVPSKSGTWAVRKEGSERAATLHDTKESAVQAGRSLAKNEGSALYVHKRDGLISDHSSYRDASVLKDTKGSDLKSSRDQTGDAKRKR